MRKILGILLVLIIILGSLGCAKTETTQMEEVSIMLDWYPNAVHSFLYAAIAEGYFAEAGLNVKILMPAETSDPLKLTAAGQTTFALSYQPQLVMARAADVPVISLGAVVNHPLNTILVRDELHLQSPRDLEGKTVGYSLPVYEAIAKTAIVNAGGDLEKVNLIDIGWDLIPAMGTANVDAISGGFINHEKILLEKEGCPVNVFDPVQYGVPDYAELILITGEDFAENNSEIITKFWEAAEKGQKFVEENPEAALQILFDYQDEQFPLDQEVEKESLKMLLPLMEGFGKQDVAGWQEVIDWMYELQLIDAKPAAEECMD
ncbi:MAG: ABC transporter substrate-binding protein [Peptococcaceae bacterium]